MMPDNARFYGINIINDRTGGTSNIAYTGNYAVGTASGFAYIITTRISKTTPVSRTTL